MDPEMVALAATAATTLVAAMTKDSWDYTKRAAASLWLWSRHPAAVETVEAELEESRQALVAVPDDAEIRQDLRTEWKMRLCRLMADNPAVLDALRELLTDPEPAARVSFGAATHSGSGHINQAAGDIHIHATGEPAAPSADLLAAMDPDRAGQELNRLPVDRAAWMLAAMPAKAAAQVLPYLVRSRLVTGLPVMSPQRCATILRSADSELAASLLCELELSVAARVLRADPEPWPPGTLAALGADWILRMAAVLGRPGDHLLATLPAETVAVAVEGMDVPTGVATLEGLPVDMGAQVLFKINRWQRVTLASRIQPARLAASVRLFPFPEAVQLMRDVAPTVAADLLLAMDERDAVAIRQALGTAGTLSI